MQVNGYVFPEKSNSQEMMDATTYFEKVGEVMKSRGVNKATPRQVSVWIAEDEARKRKILKKRKYKEKITIKIRMNSIWNPVKYFLKNTCYSLNPFKNNK